MHRAHDQYSGNTKNQNNSDSTAGLTQHYYTQTRKVFMHTQSVELENKNKSIAAVNTATLPLKYAKVAVFTSAIEPC